MKRTPVVLAFFVASLLVGIYVAFQVQTTETFTIAQEIGEPVRSEVMPVVTGDSGPKELKESPYEVTEDAKLFAFDDNRKSADCCPSPFVSDMGCICLTDTQKAQFASRGGNGKV
jgi:hypothetical protein|uniref:Uncharacterized protein n=1 Tax=viral metagenome TaxID=1070528 RepID=A0A6C0JI45_9ZZZZ